MSGKAPHRNILRAVRFGGYPEMVRGLADAIYAGGTLDANVGDRSPMAGEPGQAVPPAGHP